MTDINDYHGRAISIDVRYSRIGMFLATVELLGDSEHGKARLILYPAAYEALKTLLVGGAFVIASGRLLSEWSDMPTIAASDITIGEVQWREAERHPDDMDDIRAFAAEYAATH